MKKRNLFILFFGLIVAANLTLNACGGNNNSDTNSSVDNSSTDLIIDSTTEMSSQNEDHIKLVSYKSAAISKLDELVNPFIQKIANEELKAIVQKFYDNEKLYINDINDLETAKEAANKVIEDTVEFVNEELKPLVIEKLNDIINPLIDAIPNEELKTSVQSFYDTEMQKISSVESLDNVATTYKEILDDTKEFIRVETEKVVIALKNKALEELDPYVIALIDKIPYETLKNDTQAFYTEEKKKLEAVNTIEGVTPCVNEIKKDLETYALVEAKKIAIAKLAEIVDEGLEKLPNESLRNDLNNFVDGEIAKLNDVTQLEDVPTTLKTVSTETATYIKELLVSTVKDYLSRLTQVESATAYDYLPVAMVPSYHTNVVSASSINYDFTTFTNVSNINKAGYGEQWQMVVENINQSVKIAKVFNVAQTALNAAGQAVNIYIENSYAEEMSYNFSGTGYNGIFEFKNNKLIFNINITASTTIPGIGTVQPIVKMEYDLAKEAKGMFVSLGDAYKIKYVVSDSMYEMATTYGITVAGHSGSRASYLSVTKSNNLTIGHIYEYTTLDGQDKIKACADFYVENGYVSVVGNKASGMIGFDGYVNELYKADEGRLLGYEVREEKTISGIKGTYNTLWFNLWDISGINSIKVTDKTDANTSSRSQVDVYLNGSSSLLVPTYNKKIVKTSRKYDIELRSRFYYTYDEENDVYVANEIKVPMMFIQEDNNIDSNFSDYPSDMLKDNGITSSVIMNQNDLNKVLNDYDTLIDIFIQNKENMSSEQIISYLEQYE
ncbi:MAG: hypothetical protein MR270_00320 [Erysipelotrichaceae bacterium]|nr:hypothetical protein [Erysipelotrichaceae bacterium]